MTAEPRPARRRRAAAPGPRAEIRPLEPRDREAVREIACRTAFRNLGSDKLFEDREVHADYWTSYYTDHYPDDSYVLDQQGEIVGYFFGCPDHRAFTRVMARRIVPKAMGKALWRWATGRYKRPESGRYLRHMLLRGAREAPHIPYDLYPATYHCNMLRKAYGQRYYSEMLLMYIDRLQARGVTGMHGHITEPAGARGIWQRLSEVAPAAHATQYDEKPTTLFKAVLGDERPMVNRVWAVSTEDYRRWTEWLREHQKI